MTANKGLVVHDNTRSFSVDDPSVTVATAGSQDATWTLQNPAGWHEVAAVFHTAVGP